MTEADAAWIDIAGRLADCAALLLDANGHVVAADRQALALLGTDDLAILQRLWAGAADQAAALCAGAQALEPTAARGEVDVAVKGSPVRFAVRMLRLREGEGRCLALLAKTGSRQADDHRVAFASKLGHDLRGPLNAMVLNLDMLRTSLEGDEVEEDLATRRRRYMAALQREIDRMNDGLTAAVAEAKAEVG